MLATLKNEITAKIAVAIFLIFALSWLYLQLFVDKSNLDYQIWGSLYGLLALWGAICGLFLSKKWGGFKSVTGKAIIFFSLGLFAQEFGQLVYSYYTYFAKIAIPYPSLGDVGYFGSIPLYILAVFYLGRAAGVTIKLQSIKHQLFAILIPALMLAFGYWMFLRDYKFDFSHPLTVFLDFGYPLGEA